MFLRLILILLLSTTALDAQGYGARLGTVKRGGKVSFEPRGPGVLFDALRDMGYSDGEDLFGFPYDWRRGPVEWIATDYPKLKRLFEHVYESTGQRAWVWSISMGGPFLQYFFARFVSAEWKARYVGSWVSASGAFDGSVQEVESLASGSSCGMIPAEAGMVSIRCSLPPPPLAPPPRFGSAAATLAEQHFLGCPQLAIKRCKHFELGANKKEPGMYG